MGSLFLRSETKIEIKASTDPLTSFFILNPLSVTEASRNCWETFSQVCLSGAPVSLPLHNLHTWIYNDHGANVTSLVVHESQKTKEGSVHKPLPSFCQK